jgi:hypothetical protein
VNHQLAVSFQNEVDERDRVTAMAELNRMPPQRGRPRMARALVAPKNQRGFTPIMRENTIRCR